MPVKVAVTCSPDVSVGAKIRTLFCEEAVAKPVDGRNSLTETDFNKLLGQLCQLAFDEGRAFEREHKDLD
mgnify:CR=1 FL=1